MDPAQFSSTSNTGFDTHYFGWNRFVRLLAPADRRAVLRVPRSAGANDRVLPRDGRRHRRQQPRRQLDAGAPAVAQQPAGLRSIGWRTGAMPAPIGCSPRPTISRASPTTDRSSGPRCTEGARHARPPSSLCIIRCAIGTRPWPRRSACGIAAGRSIPPEASYATRVVIADRHAAVAVHGATSPGIAGMKPSLGVEILIGSGRA